MVFGLKKGLFGSRKRNIFYDLLEQQAQKTLEGMEALTLYVEEGTKECGARVTSIERDADDLRRLVILELDKTFVTPMDREDIYNLSRAIDDVMDYADTTVDEMKIFGVRADRYVMEMVNILRRATRELRDALKHLDSQPKLAASHAAQAKAFENSMEGRYHHALADLFQGQDIVHMLKMREIYRHLSNAADRGDEAADIILGIVTKHT